MENKDFNQELETDTRLIADLPVAYICLDTQLSITQWNPAAERLFGFAFEDALGTDIRELIAPETLCQGITDILWAQLRNTKPQLKILRNIKKDGDLCFCEWHLTSIVGQTKEPHGIQLFLIDKSDTISVHERFQELEKRFEAVFALAPVGIFRANLEGQFLSVNPEFAWMLGYESPQALTQNVSDMAEQLFANEAQREDFFFYLFEQEQLSNFRIQVFRKDGAVSWALANAQVVRNEEGRQYCIDGFLMDINKLVRVEGELRKARAVAEAATESKSRFLANMSHEIRTPMNAIIGFTDLVLKTDLSAKQKDYLSKIAMSAQALLGLINDILDLSKIEAGKLDLDHVDFRLFDLVNNLNDMFAHRVNEKGIDLLITIAQGTPTALVGDPLRVGQVLINLITNAIKFTDQGEVVVFVSQVERDKERIRLQFSVSDTGIGIGEAQIDKLFTSFSQADSSTTRKYGGTGLGLAISKQLVGMMGGEIWVTSQLHQGSTFAFTVVLDVQPEDRDHKQELPLELQDIRVLVVDAHAASREVLMLLLTAYACRVETVATAEEAIYELRTAWQANRAYDLVLIDWLLLHSDSVEAIKAIRTWERKLPFSVLARTGAPKIKMAEMPLILMVAFGQEAIQARAEEAGVTAFLSKPVKQTALFNLLLKVFGLEALIPDYKEAGGETPQDVFDDLNGVRVLLVEDIKINQQVAMELLKSQRVQVTLAENGREALELVRIKPFDAVLMDIQMPEMDGYEATRGIRQDKRFADLPIIAMTAHAMLDEREKCLEVGMNDHLTKPIEPYVLFACLSKWIPEKAKQRALDNGQSPASGAVIPQYDVDLPQRLIGLDLKAGLEKVAHNKKLYLELLFDFRRTYENTSYQIDAALKTDQWEQARYLVHTIKSVAGNLGAMTLSTLANQLEKVILEKQESRFQELSDRLAIVLETVFDSIDNFKQMLEETIAPQLKAVRSNRDSQTESVDMQKVLDRLERLGMLLETDMRQALDCFQTCREEFGETHVWVKLGALEGYMMQFDTDRALACIKKLIRELKHV